MAEPASGSGTELVSFEAFGVQMYLAANRPEAIERLPSVLPPGWRPCPMTEAKHRLALIGDNFGTYGIDLGGTVLITEVPLDLALEVLERTIRTRIALNAPERIFVHAGVVAHAGRALLLPGRSFSGKTTLVASLVRAGAVYYSDEFAPLDGDGLVHPYAKPLSLRGDDQLQTDHDVQGLGGVAGEEPLPVGAVVAATYRPAAEWRPRRLSAGAGGLALLSHTVPARDRPEQSLRAITRAVEDAVLLEGDRGEADAVAPLLLAELGARTP